MNKNMSEIYSSKNYQSFAELQEQISKSYKPIYDMAIEMQSQYSALAAPLLKLTEHLRSTLSSVIQESLTDESFQQPLLAMQNALSTFTTSLGAMKIHTNYVSVPESLIPEDFSYEEITEDSADNSNEVTKTAVPAKRLSFADTLAILGMLINILIFAITQFQLDQSSLREQKNHNEQVAIETEGNSIQEERNKILQSQVETLEKQTEYLLAIYKKVEEAGSASPELDLTLPDTDSALLSPASPSQCAGSYQPEEVDEFDDPNTFRKTD